MHNTSRIGILHLRLLLESDKTVRSKCQHAGPVRRASVWGRWATLRTEVSYHPHEACIRESAAAGDGTAERVWEADQKSYRDAGLCPGDKNV
jgi:hypothetical protein